MKASLLGISWYPKLLESTVEETINVKFVDVSATYSTTSQDSEVLRLNEKTAFHNSKALRLICGGCSSDDEDTIFR